MRLCVAIALVAMGCDKPAPPAPAASASAAPQAPSAAPAASATTAPSAAPAKEQSWRGEYTAQAYAIEVPKNEGAREWGADDGGELSGKGTLGFTVAASGAIHGSASGALGEHDVVGQVEGDALRIRFVPKAPGDRAFGGVAVLAREGDAMKGRLQGSTGDSKTVRDALISVSREGAGTAQSPAPSSSR